MNGLTHIAAAGAKEVMQQQALNANNLANASTPGFKADLARAETQYLRGAGAQTRAYTWTAAVDTDVSSGPIQQTGRDLDIAVNGPGWIAVQGPGGVEALTRRGDLRIDEFGQLSNGAGQLVLGDAGPIALPPFSSMTIGVDGTISIVPLGAQPNALATLDRIKLVNPPEGSLAKNSAGVLVADEGLPSPPDGSVRLTTGALEASNVSPVESMVHMLELARQFEQFMRMLSVGEELDTSSSRLMQLQ